MRVLKLCAFLVKFSFMVCKLFFQFVSVISKLSPLCCSRDDSMTNGHSENLPESPQPDSPSSGSSPSSPTSPVPVSTPDSVINGTAEADTSKESIEPG